MRASSSLQDPTDVLYADAVSLRRGLIRSVSGSGLAEIDLNGRVVSARRAASCLLDPEPGDLVLVSVDEADAFVLAILNRPGDRPANLSVRVPNPRLRMKADEIVVEAQTTLHLAAPAITTQSRRFTIFADVLGLVGHTLTQAFQQWRVSAKSTEIVSTDIAMQAARRTSLISDVDTLNAGAVVNTIETAAMTSAQVAVVTASQDLRLDGQRVTVG